MVETPPPPTSVLVTVTGGAVVRREGEAEDVVRGCVVTTSPTVRLRAS